MNPKLKHILNILFFFLLALNSTNATNLPDSLLQKLDGLEGKERMKAWYGWFSKCPKSQSEYCLELIEVACEDAHNTFDEKVAKVWCYDFVDGLSNIYSFTLDFKERNSLLQKSKVYVEEYNKLHSGPSILDVNWAYSNGVLYYHTGQYEKALEIFKEGLKLNETVKNQKRELLLNFYMGRAIDFAEGDEKEAIKYYLKGIELMDEVEIPLWVEYNLQKGLANAYRELKQYKEAEKIYEAFIHDADEKAEPNVILDKMDYWNLLSELGKTDQAVSLFEALEKERYDKSALFFKFYFIEEYTYPLCRAGRFEDVKRYSQMYRQLVWEDEKNIIDNKVLGFQTKKDAETKDKTISRLEESKAYQQAQMNFKLSLFGILALLLTGVFLFLINRNKNQQKALTIQTDRDQEITEIRNRFFSSITHDIRTPLALMMAPMERVSYKSDKEEVKQDIKMAQRNGQRLMDLFTQILDWNKVESQALILNPQIGQLDLAIQNICLRYKQDAIEKGIRFENKIEVPAGSYRIDFDKLEKVLYNLLHNAFKFCTAGNQVKLDIKLENNNQLFIELKDNGPGIPKEEQVFIFDRYFQGALGKEKGGTGIGLAIAKEIIDLMQGEIKLESASGQGTKFLIQFPIEEVAETKEENNIITNQIPSRQVKTTLLVIEDDPDLADFIKSVFEQKYELKVANSANVGWSIAQSVVPDIVISDWNLPDQNGGWVCNQIKKNPLTAHIPVMILTGNNNDLNKKQAFDAGAIAWMSKPFQIDLLQKQLKSLILQQENVREKWRKNHETKQEQLAKEQEVLEEIDPFLQQATTLINEHISNEAFGVEQMAEHFGIHRVQLGRKIKSLTGSSPKKIILDIRMKKAMTLLQKTENGIAEVAYATGFSNPNYFATAFKKYFEMTPTEAQKNRND